MQWDIVKSEIKEIKKKYPCDRRTKIVYESEKITVKRDDVKRAVTDWAVSLTAAGTVRFTEKPDFVSKFKRPLNSTAPLTAMHTQAVFVKSDATLVCFTNLGNCLYINLENVDITTPKVSGYKLRDICPEALPQEMPVKIFTQEERKGDLLFFTKDGMVKRTSWEEYTLNKGYYQAIKLKEGDAVINVENYDEDEFSTMFFVTAGGMCLNAVKDDVPVHGRIAAGVKGINIDDKENVIFASQINGEGEIITISASGYFKRVISSLIDPIGRARKGVIIADVKDCGRLLFADYVTIPYTLAIVNEDKSVAELSTEDISIENRISRGKKLKRTPPVSPVKVFALKQKSDDGKGGGGIQLRF